MTVIVRRRQSERASLLTKKSLETVGGSDLCCSVSCYTSDFSRMLLITFVCWLKVSPRLCTTWEHKYHAANGRDMRHALCTWVNDPARDTLKPRQWPFPTIRDSPCVTYRRLIETLVDVTGLRSQGRERRRAAQSARDTDWPGLEVCPPRYITDSL